MGFLDSVTENDLKLIDTPIFTKDEKVEFAVTRVNEYVKPTETGNQVTLALHTKVLTGANEGRTHTLYLRDSDKEEKKQLYIRGVVGLFGRDAIKNKTAVLSNLVNTKISAVAGRVWTTREGKDMQDFLRYENLGQLDPSLHSTNVTPA